MGTSFFITEIFLNLLLFFSMRFWNIKKFKAVGCDSFNMLLNVEAFKKKKNFQLILEIYLCLKIANNGIRHFT